MSASFAIVTLILAWVCAANSFQHPLGLYRIAQKQQQQQQQQLLLQQVLQQQQASLVSLFAGKRNTDRADQRAQAKQILKHSILAVEDERQLAQQYKLGMQLKTQFDVIEKASNFSHAIQEITSKLDISRKELLVLIRRGDIARNLLVRANMRLAYHIAEFFKKRGITQNELMQEAGSGLYKAVDRYEPDKGFRFSTYASWWIKQALFKAVMEHNDNLIKIPTKLNDLIVRVSQFKREYYRAHNRYPSRAEIAEGLEISKKKVTEALEGKLRYASPEDLLYGASSKMSSSKRTVKDMLPSKEKTIDSTFEDEDEFLIQSVLSKMPQYEGEILATRFGLDDGIPKSIEEVGNKYNITRERIRQIESNAVLNLKLLKL